MQFLSRAEEIVLVAVFKRQDDAYGVTIRDQVRRDIGRSWSFGVIYRTLKKVRAKGYVLRQAGAPLAERGGRTRFYYRITPQGIAVLKEIRAVQAALWKGVPPLSVKE